MRFIGIGITKICHDVSRDKVNPIAATHCQSIDFAIEVCDTDPNRSRVRNGFAMDYSRTGAE